MFSDENHLSVPKQERDLFTAHEVLQMKPLFDRGDTYAKFLFDNEWVKKYLPNALNIKNQKSKIKNTNKKVNVFSLVETVLKKFQLWYMRKKRTTEVIKEGMIRFHPHDAREWVMKSYGQECRKFKLQS